MNPTPLPHFDLDPDEDIRHIYFHNRRTLPKRCRWFHATLDETCSKWVAS